MKKTKIISIGGCGTNIVNTIVDKVPKEILTVNLSPNYSDHNFSKADVKFVIGDEITNGLACDNTEVGEKIANDNKFKIDYLLEGTDILFLVAGLGGGTGTGITPIVANIASKKNIFSIGIITIPYNFEGKRRQEIANKGIEKLEKELDALVIIKQDNLVISDSLIKNFKYADSYIGQVIIDILKIIKEFKKIDEENTLEICKKYNIEIRLNNTKE